MVASSNVKMELCSQTIMENHNGFLKSGLKFDIKRVTRDINYHNDLI